MKNNSLQLLRKFSWQPVENKTNYEEQRREYDVEKTLSDLQKILFNYI